MINFLVRLTARSLRSVDANLAQDLAGLKRGG